MNVIHVHTADADATRQNSFVSSASAVCIELYCTRERVPNGYERFVVFVVVIPVVIRLSKY